MQTSGQSRNGFLDFVRTAAILRVLVWHTYGVAWISYVIATMPAMFFVAGTLVAQSTARSGHRKVLRDRFKRILPPLWLFASVAITVMVAYEALRPGPATRLELSHLGFWLLPVWDPVGSPWGVTWWASLWYLRCMVWLLLLTPVLLWAFRRAWVPALLAPAVAVAALEVARRAGHAPRWQFDDLALYSFFWMLGFAYHDGHLAGLGRGWRALLMGLFAAAAAAWVLTQDVPGHVVNASYPAHLFMGLAWLFLAFTLERQIARLAAARGVRTVVSWVNQRALSIYLWHAAGLFCAYHIFWSGQHSDAARYSLALPAVAAVTFACVLAVGWVEDIAGGRPPRFWPAGGLPLGRLGEWRAAPVALVLSGTAAALFVGTFAALTLRDEGRGTTLPVVRAAPPSGVGLQIRTARAVVVDREPERAPTSATGPVTTTELDAELARWLTDSGLTGVAVGLRRPDGSGWSGAVGENSLAGKEMNTDDRYAIASVTKTFTVAMVMQLAEQGLLGLDDTVGRFVPSFPNAGQMTIRELIQHTSGLISTDGAAPADALEAAAAEPLLFAPGTGFEYSTPGYFLLALVIEDVTGESYTDSLHRMLLDPLGLTHTAMDEELEPTEESTHPYRRIPSAFGYRGVVWSSGGLYLSTVKRSEYHGQLWSSAGLYSTVDDLARWGALLWSGSGGVVSSASLDEMTTFLGPEFQYTGLGTYPFCPCWHEGDRIRGQRWGHLGKTGELEYDPGDQVAIAVYTNETVLDERVIVAYDDLSRRLRDLIRGRPLPVALGGG